MDAKPATVYQGLTGSVQNVPAPLEARICFLRGPTPRDHNISVGEAIEVLEKNGYKVFPANRIEAIYAEYNVDELQMRYGGLEFQAYLNSYVRSYLADVIGRTCAPKLAVLGLPSVERSGICPFRSEVDVFIPTKQELERRYRDRDRAIRSPEVAFQVP